MKTYKFTVNLNDPDAVDSVYGMEEFTIELATDTPEKLREQFWRRYVGLGWPSNYVTYKEVL